MSDLIGKIKKIKLLTKRQKIIATSVVLSLGLLYTQLVPFYLTTRFIVALSILCYFLSLWALWEGISKLKAVTLLVLPTLFTLAVASYYFLLPVRWLTRLPVATLFGLSFYSLLLSQNVFNVASIRTIPLYRAASTVNFLFTLITAFLLYNVLFSFEMLFLFNGLAVFALSFLLILQVIWSIQMEKVDNVVLINSLLSALVIGELALALSFWPISTSMFSLTVATALYICLGVVTHSLRGRLTREVAMEYLGVGVVVFLVALLTTSWIN